MQIKATMKFYDIHTRIEKLWTQLAIPSVADYAEQPYLSYITDKNAKWYSHFGKLRDPFLES